MAVETASIAAITGAPTPGAITPARAVTVILAAPNHLIGERAQIEHCRTSTRRGKKAAELPPWYAEWHDFLPGWHIETLETPHQVATFFAGAPRDPATPRVGMITNA